MGFSGVGVSRLGVPGCRVSSTWFTVVGLSGAEAYGLASCSSGGADA